MTMDKLTLEDKRTLKMSIASRCDFLIMILIIYIYFCFIHLSYCNTYIQLAKITSRNNIFMKTMRQKKRKIIFFKWIISLLNEETLIHLSLLYMCTLRYYIYYLLYCVHNFVGYILLILRIISIM